MSKTYAIADLHGRYDLLCDALASIAAYAGDETGTVVTLGDYVDRGPQSRQIVERLMDGLTDGWSLVCLKGNHEDMMVGAVRGDYHADWWIGNGGGNTMASYGAEPPKSHIDWMANLPLSYTDGKRIFCHAGVDETVPIAEQIEETLVWSRVGKHVNYQHDEGYVVHGHTPFEDGPIELPGRLNLDTGAVWTNRLVVAVFDDAKDGGPIDYIEVRSSATQVAEAA